MNGNDMLEFEENHAQEIEEAWNKLKGRPADTEISDSERDSEEFREFVDNQWDSYRADQVDAAEVHYGI